MVRQLEFRMEHEKYLLIFDDFHVKLFGFDKAFDSFQVDPEIVCVENSKLRHALEVFHLSI